MSRLTSFLILVLLISTSSISLVQGVGDDWREAIGQLHQMNGRKLMVGVDFPDYDYGGPNKRHDPTVPPPYSNNP